MKAKSVKKKSVKKTVDTILCLRTCREDGSNPFNGFRWPLVVGAVATAPDWDPKPECGAGLHGLAWGAGDAGLVDRGPHAVGLVVEARADEVVDLGGKVKFPSATVRFVGTLAEAASWLAAETGRVVHFAGVTAGDHGHATAGDHGTATAGDGGHATAGVYGEIRIQWFDGGRYRTAVGYTGEDGIEAGVPYRVVFGKLAKAA